MGAPDAESPQKHFRVIVRQDAFKNYTAIIPADTAEEAVQIAKDAWNDGDAAVKFEEDDVTTYDDITVEPDECEETDAQGEPLE